MRNTILKYGTIAGLIVGIHLAVIGIGLKDHMPSEWGMALGYLVMLIAFSMIFIAVKRERDGPGGGIIRFLPALGMGAAIALIASLFYVLAWEIVLAVNQTDFISAYASAELERRRAAGASAGDLAKMKAEMDWYIAAYANPVFRMMLTITEIMPVGLFVALLCAVLLRNPRFLPARG